MFSTRLDDFRLAWLLALCAAAIDGAWLVATGISLPPMAVMLKLSIAAAVLIVAWYYATIRREEGIAALFHAAALLIVATMALGIASYLSIGLNLPLRDALFASLDKAMGFDWQAHLRYVSERPWLAGALNLAYASALPQVVVVILALAFSRQTERLATFTLLFVVTGAIVIAISSLVPAVGAYAYHRPAEDMLRALPDAAAGRWHLTHFTALRNGSLGIIPLDQIEGLVSFPSFHTVLAILTMWALATTRWLAGPAIVLNCAVILSTLAIGGHYLVDVIGGAIIAVSAVVLACRRAAVSRDFSARPQHAG